MQDFDGSAARMLRMNYFNDWEQTSHEFRITSDLDGPYNYVAGIYKWDSEYRIDLVSFTGRSLNTHNPPSNPMPHSPRAPK